MSGKIILVVSLLMFFSIQGCASASGDRSIFSHVKDPKKKVEVGMNQEEVLEILGKPARINTSNESQFLSEGEVAWHYDRVFFGPYRVVYFKNGLVTQVEGFYK